MKVLFITGTPYLPQVRGGVEVNTHELAIELSSRGHHVSVLCRLSHKDFYGVKAGIHSAMSKRPVRDTRFGYEIFRSRNIVDAVGKLGRPDIAVIQNGRPDLLAAALAARDIPTIVYHHGLGFERWPNNPQNSAHPCNLQVSWYLSISEFTASRFQTRFGIRSDVIPPVFRAERYRTKRDPKYVTFINPVSVKGVELALALAERCPDVQFCFVKGWPLGIIGEMRLKGLIKRLGNIEFLGNVDMKAVYAQTKILIVPSQWEAETWGRVASEAQYSGIPVVATDRGGLPEAVGPGGVLIAASEPIDAWVTEINRLWNDETFYQEKSAAALIYSQRPALDLADQITTFERILNNVVEREHTTVSTDIATRGV